MGKVRIKTFGLPEEEEKEKKKLKQKKEAKKLAKGAHGGERIVAVGPTQEEIEQIAEAKQEVKPETLKQKKEKFVQKAKKKRSQSYQFNAKLIDKSKAYPLSDALKILIEFKKAKFDETVELHVNTKQGGISTNATLPHGAGKKVRVAIADDPSARSGQVSLEALINKIESGNLDFDILVAHPNAMPKLAKVAKILGPRGLMPNPKSGTISDNPESLVEKFQTGHVNIKTEAKTPIIHLAIGKVSFGEKKLADNIRTLLDAIKKENIKKVVLKSTMSPGIKIQY